MKIINSKIKRSFVSKDLKINKWGDIAPFFLELKQSEIKSVKDLKKLLKDRSELEAILEEEVAWRYIKSTCDTKNKEIAESFEYFISEIEPEINKESNVLDKKIYKSEFLKKLDKDKYLIPIRNLKLKIELFNEKNIPVIAELQKLEQEYGVIAAAMTISYNNEEITLQKAANYLKNNDRAQREEIYNLINNRRLKDKTKLNDLLSVLIEKRTIIAKNSGYNNYRDYKHKELARFDYTTEDILQFHESIKETVVPLLEKIHTQRKKELNYKKLKPFDLDVDTKGKEAVIPFKNTDELIEKTIKLFSKIDSEFGNYIYTMKHLSYLDLEARIGKAPGGYNYPLYESNVPFIFMNSTNNLRDLETMMHESGHAVHSFLSKDLELIDFKSLPSEVAELASMSMELISMEYWDIFIKDKDELKRAKQSQLEGVISVLPWVATVDKFQHWLYLNPKHNIEERENKWKEIFYEFSGNIIDFSSFEAFVANSWQKQLHIFEVPFYYIEYAISQLGAIAVWKNFKENKELTIENYKKALSLGYSKTIPEIYKTAGIKFSFEKKYIAELTSFVFNEYKKLKN